MLASVTIIDTFRAAQPACTTGEQHASPPHPGKSPHISSARWNDAVVVGACSSDELRIFKFAECEK